MTVATKHILVVGRDSDDAARLARMLEESNYDVTLASDPALALESVQGGGVDLVITDHDEESINGINLLLALKQINPGVKVVMVSRLMDLDTYLKVMNLGCEDALEMPFQVSEMLRVVENALKATSDWN